MRLPPLAGGIIRTIIDIYPLIEAKYWEVNIPWAKLIYGPYGYPWPYNNAPDNWGRNWWAGPITGQYSNSPNLGSIPDRGKFGIWIHSDNPGSPFHAQHSAWEATRTRLAGETVTMSQATPHAGPVDGFPAALPRYLIPPRDRARPDQDTAQPSGDTWVRPWEWVPGEGFSTGPAQKPGRGDPTITIDVISIPGGPATKPLISGQEKPRSPNLPTPDGSVKEKTPGVKEKKTILNRAAHTLFARAVSSVTETADFITAVYEALPKKFRAHQRMKRHGKDPRLTVKAQLIYDNFDDLNVEDVLTNLIKNEIEDRAIGKANKKLHKMSRRQYNMLKRMHGWSVGPAL